MSKSVTIDIKSLKDLEKRILKAGERSKKELALEFKATTLDTFRVAKRFAPVDKGDLRNQMFYDIIDDFEAKIGNNKDYAPYVEFGTGIRANIPTELSDFANQFKGSTGEKWTNGLEEIKAWCSRQGIPEEAAYPIFMSILKNGIESQPFLYPAYKAGQKVLIKRITNYIKNFGLND